MNDGKANARLLLCTRYGCKGASSRLRFYAYADALAAGGFAVSEQPFFSDAYLDRLYLTGRKSSLSAAAALLKRALSVRQWPQNLFIEYELFPQIPYFAEAVFLCGRRYVLNFDDNVWEKYHSRLLRNKYDRLISGAAGVVAANDFLQRRIAPLNANVIKVPTAIDLTRYPVDIPKRPRFTLCWIGTPVTYKYVEEQTPIWQAMARNFDFDMLIIGGSELASRRIPGVNMFFSDWSSSNENELISSCHAGIMPLGDDAFAQGKSAYKLIQYLGAGLPVIASNIGENNLVATPECGFAVPNNAAAWCDAMRCLQNASAYWQLAAGAKNRAAEYSLQKYRPILTDFLRRAFDVAKE